MAIIDDIPEPTDAELTEYMHWWEHGPGIAHHPVHRRVWSDGVDVTDQDPATWPDLWTNPERYRRSRAGRSSRMGHG